MLLVFILSFAAQTAWAQDLTISSAEEWNTFATAVNNGTSYSGQTVALTADIEVSTMVGTSDNRFQGTFLGNGHTLTFNATATGTQCAPFSFIDGATIKFLKVAGTIETGYKYAGGIAGYCYGNCTIQNCHSSITINSTVDGDGTHGGFVGQQEDASLTISNCLFDGSITGENTTCCGGFVGWRCDEGTLMLNNCLMAGTMSINQDAESAVFSRNDVNTLTDCYYDDRKSYGTITAQGTATTATGSDLQTLLGSGWIVSGTSVEPITGTKNLATATISGISSSLWYTGEVLNITYTVTTADGTALTEGTHYTATITKDGSVSAVQEKGDYTLTITATEGSGYTGTQIFDFTVDNIPPGMSVDNQIAEGTVGHYYVNMPKTGTTTINIPEGFTSPFKVYDDGGSTGNYSDRCDGYLVLTAPEGYILQLSGNISTESDYDKLTAYDGNDNTGKTLLDHVSSNSSGTETAIETVVSSGQNMTLYFYSDGSNNYAGLDLTVTLVNPNTEYNITVNSAEGGSVSSEPATAKVNATVTLTASPQSGYILSDISVVDASNNDISVEWNVWTNTATFNMPGSAVTVTPTFTDLTSLSVNMPQTGTKYATISEGVQSFKVYDDGGSAGNYSDKCDGYLVLTAPEGYVLQLSGNISTESGYDKLTAYDGNDNTGKTLLDHVSSNSSGTETAIETVVSSGQNMTLYFHSDGSKNYAGLDLTVTLVDQNAEYAITVSNPETGVGSVVASVGENTATTAKVNETVILTATPSTGYVLSDISVVDASNNDISVEWNVWTNTATFNMPGSAVTVTPTFTEMASLSVNMPQTGTKYATIPEGVQSFKVYDDGGSAGNYSDKCDGYLVLTAPEGYVLQLSGNISTESDNDYLTAYDGNDKTGTQLLRVSGSETAIETVVSSGQNMTLYFHSDGSNNYAGLDLTVTLVNPNTEYNITVNSAEGGSVSSEPATAKVNAPVTLNASPAEGHILSDISVVDASNNVISVEWNVWTNTATFKMPASAVTVTPTFTDDLTTLSINMPKTGTKYATIPEGVQSFKVYDDGGLAGNYSDKCDGYLVLTAPTGYLLRLSGKITTESGNDYLTAYDGNDKTGTQLLRVSGSETAIETVVSSGQNMTLYFNSSNDNNHAGLDLTVTLVNPNTEYNITVNSAEGGSVISEPTTAKLNETVRLNATPSTGYILSDISVVNASNNDISVEWNEWTNTATFKMPVSAVAVTPTFTNKWTADGGLYINMPKTDSKQVAIPEGVQSFKVYDDGGSTGKYSDYCEGYLVLTAPTGYVLQLSGNISTESGYDKLTAYDGNDNTGTKLLDQVSGSNTAITTVVSSGQNMTLYFHSDVSENFAGLDLTVTLISVVIDGNSNAPVSFSETTENATVLFKRNFTAGYNSTVILPFGFNLDDDFKSNYGNFYSLTTIRYNETDNQWEGWLDNPVNNEVAANTPYVFVPSNTFTSITFENVTIEPTTPIDVTFGGDNNDDWTFKGTYSQIENFETHDKPIYGFAGTNNSSIAVGEFVRANKSKVSIKPLRCYLEYNGSDKALTKSAVELPDHIVLRIIDSTIDPGDPTENPDTDITTPTSELNPAANVKVWSYDKTICIAAAPNTPYRIIDATGRVLKDGITQTDRDEIRLGNHSGIVIVIIKGKTFKVSY